MNEKSGLRSVFALLERNFATAGLAEGDPSVARAYMEDIEGNDGSSFFQWVIEKIKAALMVFENSFAAAGLAEGDPSIARDFLAGVEAVSGRSFVGEAKRRIKAMLRIFEDSSAAAAMAEGGPELAIEFLESRESQPKAASFLTFIKDIGLQDIPVQYGIATLQVEKAS